jgi:hypothetical protein
MKRLRHQAPVERIAVQDEVPGVAPGQDEWHFEDRIGRVDADGSGDHVDQVERQPAQCHQAREQPEDEDNADGQFMSGRKSRVPWGHRSPPGSERTVARGELTISMLFAMQQTQQQLPGRSWPAICGNHERLSVRENTQVPVAKRERVAAPGAVEPGRRVFPTERCGTCLLLNFLRGLV